LATPNYSYEKRQRELAKKRKKEEKQKRKSSDGAPSSDGPTGNEGQPSGGPAGTPPSGSGNA